MNFNDWVARHPEAAADLSRMIGAVPWAGSDQVIGKSESWAQQHQRFQFAQAGGMAWRNNVGATPTKCRACGEKQQPVRYGLANDSSKLNKEMKSSDLIGIMPRLITPSMVGQTIGQFASIEVKQPGWQYKGVGREPAQAAWLSLVAQFGGYATFSTGECEL